MKFPGAKRRPPFVTLPRHKRSVSEHEALATVNLADWAKKPEVQAAFPVVKSILDGAGSKESKHAIKLTSQGWEAKGLD